MYSREQCAVHLKLTWYIWVYVCILFFRLFSFLGYYIILTWEFPVLYNRSLKSESVSHFILSNSLNPIDCSLPGSSVHGILQATILEWVANPFSRGSSQPRSLAFQANSLLSEPPRKPNKDSRSLLVIYFIYSNVYMLIPASPFSPVSLNFNILHENNFLVREI